MVRRWDCIFVDRINSNGRIYLTQPQEYGCMYSGEDETPIRVIKVRKSIPRKCGPIEGSSNEDQILIATAIATVCNHSKLITSSGLVLRGFESRTPLPGLQKALQSQKKSLRKRGSTGWLVFISSELRFYSIDGNHLGEELTTKQCKKILECIKSIRNNLN